MLDKDTARALKYTRRSWMQFIRNGRWGTCVACPCDNTGEKYPEFCEFTGRYDHWLTLDGLVEQYKMELKPRDRESLAEQLEKGQKERGET